MVSRLGIAFSVLLGFLAFAGQPSAQATGEQDLRSFRDWTTACPKQGGACSANVYVLNRADPGHFDYRLTARPADGATGYSLSFTSPALGLDSGKGIALRVDDNKTVNLAPGAAFVPEPGAADSVVIGASASLRDLVKQMRKGKEVRVGFTDRVGRPQTVGFSLMGVTAALRHIAAQGGGSGAAEAGSSTSRAGVQQAILSVPAAEDWSERLPDFLSAMRTCLAATPGGPATVTRAWPMDKGMVGVRTRGPDGLRWDCFVAGGTPAVATFDAVPKDDKGLPGEAAPLFTPPGQTPAEDGCSRSERVRDENGDFVGWLTYRTC